MDAENLARESTYQTQMAVSEDALRIMNCKKPYSDLASATDANYMLESVTCPRSVECPNFEAYDPDNAPIKLFDFCYFKVPV